MAQKSEALDSTLPPRTIWKRPQIHPDEAKGSEQWQAGHVPRRNALRCVRSARVTKAFVTSLTSGQNTKTRPWYALSGWSSAKQSSRKARDIINGNSTLHRSRRSMAQDSARRFLNNMNTVSTASTNCGTGKDLLYASKEKEAAYVNLGDAPEVRAVGKVGERATSFYLGSVHNCCKDRKRTIKKTLNLRSISETYAGNTRPSAGCRFCFRCSSIFPH